MDAPDSTTPCRACTKCGRTFPATEEFWYRKKGRLDGFSSSCRECTRAKVYRYREENPDKWADTRKRYYETHKLTINEQRQHDRCENPELFREKDHKYYARHAERLALEKRKIRAADPEHARAVDKAHYAKTRDRHAALRRETRKRSPERVRARESANTHHRRAQARASGGRFTADDLATIRKGQTDKRGRVRCWYCGKPMLNWHIDHRIPLSRGGSNAPGNLCLACPECNLRKHNKLPTEYAGRLV